MGCVKHDAAKWPLTDATLDDEAMGLAGPTLPPEPPFPGVLDT
jgi:hypothetical protein